MQQLQWNNKLAIATSQERIRKYPSDLELKIFCFKDSNIIYGYSLKILWQNNFPLADQLNQFILNANNAGLIHKWSKANRHALVFFCHIGNVSCGYFHILDHEHIGDFYVFHWTVSFSKTSDGKSCVLLAFHWNDNWSRAIFFVERFIILKLTILMGL